MYPFVYSENRVLILFDIMYFVVLLRGKLGARYKHVSEETGV